MASKTAPKPKILMVMNGPPWSSWTMSGVSLGVCNELRRRDLLYGAISQRCLGTRTLKSPGCFFDLYEKACRWLNLWLSGSQSRWTSENSGGLGDLLSHAPAQLPVIYTYVNPDHSDEYNLRRFRWIGISVLDAARNKAYGYKNISNISLKTEFDQQYSTVHKCEAIFTHSSYGADSIARDYNYPREKIFPIGAGASLKFDRQISTDIERYRRANILFVGRDWERKGGPLVYQAFLLLKEKLPNATLTIVGPTTAPVSGDGIRFEGFLRKHKYFERRRLKQLFQNASLFCTPSVCETWGLVYVEAAACGLPIVGTDEWAMPDIVLSEKTGVLCSQRTPQMLAAGMEAILSNPSVAKAMGEAAIDHAGGVLDWPHVVDRIIAAISPESLEGRQIKWLPGDLARAQNQEQRVSG